MWFRGSVKERRANSGLRESIHGGIAVIRRRIIVTPIDQSRGSAIELVDCSDESRYMHIFGTKQWRYTLVNAAKILGQSPVRSNAS
jgi:hypothetical protein